MGVEVPAGEVVRKESLDLEVPVDVELVAVTPRALEICVSSTLVAEYPDGSRQRILSIPDWNHHARQTHVLSRPMVLPAGTRIRGEWVLDNTRDNPRNPDAPPVDVIRRKRAGILGTLLHVAAREDADKAVLDRFGVAFIRSGQRR